MSLTLKEKKAAFCDAVERMPQASANLLMPVMTEILDKEGDAAIFLSRGIRALVELLEQANLPEAVAASSDYNLLLNVLQQPGVIPLLVAKDPLAKAKIRGILAKPQLLEAEGGCLSSDEAARLLGISREAVNKRRQQGKLIGLPAGRSYRYPVWQFQDGKTLTGLETVLQAIKVQDPWMQVAWMLNSNLRLGQRPLDALRSGEIEPVEQVAFLYGEQGAL
jgi:Helix-turn-helix domain